MEKLTGPALHGGLRAVIADDDRTVRLLARIAMERLGFEVIEAEDGERALEAISACLPDIVLLDVMMPGMDGFAACRALRGTPEGERIPVVIITGRDDDDSIKQAYDAGATDFVTKPINWAILGHRVRYILRASRALNEAWENERRLANAQRVAGLGDWDWDVARARLRASEEVYRILERSIELPATTLHALFEGVHEADRAQLHAVFEAAVERAEYTAFDHRIVLPDGRVRFVHHQVKPGRIGADGSAARIVGTIQDITDRKHVEERVRQLAYFDSLTGLPNRLLFNELARKALASAERTGARLAVMFVDLDGFKAVNDTLGHDAGDELLRIVAGRIGGSVRHTDTVGRAHSEASVARLGGDEFVVLLTGVLCADDVSIVARRILGTLAAPAMIGARKVEISGSVGIAVYPEHGGTYESLLASADAAMYRAKSGGRNTFRYFSDPQGQQE